jgi:hypothetical protein
MRSMPTWLTISMLAGVFGWGCYEHARRVTAESSVAAPAASEACDSPDDNADDDADDNETSADDRDDADDSDEQDVTIVEVTTTDRHGSTHVVRIQ